MRPRVFRLCYITDRRALEPKPLLPIVLEAIRAGVDLVQIREKDLATRDLLDLVDAAVGAARQAKSGTLVIVNDRLDVALAAGASGVHLGAQSMPAREVRRIAPDNFLVGVSCHSLEEALEAESTRADYALLGPIYETPSKLPYGPPLGLEKLREVATRVKIPVLALGGITVERASACLEAGATGIAGISVFQTAPSLRGRVRALREQGL
ncbi:MAG: thiamine phosphate synthase [Acidobacteria bacterium]|nr:thiamine phosphate synthase [Acidobacteriota bacterium]